MKYFFLLISLLGSFFVFSQNYILEIIPEDNFKNERLNYKKKHKDSISALIEIKNFINKQHSNGYLSASIDSFFTDSINIKAFLNRGEKYILKKINFVNIDNYQLNKIGIKKKKIENTDFDMNNIDFFSNKICSYFENNGYPFVNTKIENIYFDKNNISLSIVVDTKNSYKIDSIHILGNAEISKNFVQKHIGIKHGDDYNDAQIGKIDNKINNLDFLNTLNSAEIEFYENTADIYLYFKKKKANRFNGIVGFLPNKTNTKLIITGEIDLKLINSLKRGETFEIKWEKVKPESQKINLGLEYPYLFRTNFGIIENFSLSKEDTSFINIKNDVGIKYFFTGENYLESFISTKRSIVLLQDRTQNTNLANISTNLYGLGIGSYNVDYKYNPKKGYIFYGKTAFGNKKMEDSLSSFQIEANINLELYFPVWKKFVLKYQNHSAVIDNKTGIYENELYKIGGLKTIRGFDEEAILASMYFINTLELRYLFDKNSNFYLFYDMVFYQQKTVFSKFEDIPMGFGAGINFSTKAGIFSLTYAVGKQKDNPFLIYSAKIHFGFISVF